ncbi:MAG: glycosyltransferase [Candidatus Kerfeldbacteria bacterium]
MDTKVSVITTVLNEAETIDAFLGSILKQTMLPDEMVVVDGGSTDPTVVRLREFTQHHPEINLRIEVAEGNRSVGRNAAISLARNDIIAVTDAGNTLDQKWLRAITEPFRTDPNVDFVGGWYQPTVKTVWDQSLAMVFGFRADRVDTTTFLPSTRSMAFKKTLWQTVGGFDVTNSHSEDTPFSIAMRKAGKKFAFAPDAVVYWHMADGYGRLYRTFDRYALGDGQMRLWMSQYIIVLTGLAIELTLFITGFFFTYILWLIGIAGAIVYLYLPLLKTGYHKNARSWYQVPLMKLILVCGNAHGFVRGLLEKRKTA